MELSSLDVSVYFEECIGVAVKAKDVGYGIWTEVRLRSQPCHLFWTYSGCAGSGSPEPGTWTASMTSWLIFGPVLTCRQLIHSLDFKRRNGFRELLRYILSKKSAYLRARATPNSRTPKPCYTTCHRCHPFFSVMQPRWTVHDGRFGRGLQAQPRMGAQSGSSPPSMMARDLCAPDIAPSHAAATEAF
jgi:hypothetical protein